MRAVIQRVKSAYVQVGEERISEIGAGLVTLLGVAQTDTEAEAHKLISKIVKLRVFEDDQGKMNRSLLEMGLPHLVVSQFTLLADPWTGNRPGFSAAARPELAKPLYERAIEISRSLGVPTEGGRFQADMQVHLVNDGPVTLVLDT
jgi:D-tyrosyl-tRNA(Tyr) deacylase